jgi:hypothetical protein
LYLKIATSGSRRWHFKYRHVGKERLVALGAYPDVSLKMAREKRDNTGRRLAGGVDPGAQNKKRRLLRRLRSLESLLSGWGCIGSALRLRRTRRLSGPSTISLTRTSDRVR